MYAKEGAKLALNIQAGNDTIEYVRSTNVIVEELRAAGIDATSQPLTGNTTGDNRANGNYDAAWTWDTCGSVNEPWVSMDTLNSRWAVAVGTRANHNQQRWNTD